MKKLSLFLSLLFSFTLFAESVYFRSNLLGMKLEQIEEYRIDEFSYILETGESADESFSILYYKGNEKKRWIKNERIGNSYRESFYVNGKISKSSIIVNNLLIEEQFFLNEILSEERIYKYKNEVLQSITVTDDTDFLYEDFYERSSGGRLRRIRRIYADGKETVSTYSFTSGKLIEESHSNSETSELFRFNNSLILSKENWEKDELVSSEVFSYNNIDSSVFTNYRSGEKIDREFDGNGNIIKEVKTVDGNIEITSFEYANDLLILKQKKAGGLREEWRYDYNEDNNLLKEEFYRNNRIIQIITYTGNDEYYKEIYNNMGRLFLKVFYSEDQAIAEEFIKSSE